MSVHPDAAVMSLAVLGLLPIYEGIGIATREGLADVPVEHHPVNIMRDFESIIVLARIPKDASPEPQRGRFHPAIGPIAAQDAAIAYLKRHGYKSLIIGSRSTKISLPRLGERAGVGTLSPVRTLAVKGYGLRTVLSAIITDAPLEATRPAADACSRPESCLKRCPALGADGVFDRKKCTSCGACVKACPNS